MAETFVFTIRREGPERTGAQAEALYEAGLDDCGADTGPAYTLVDAAREAPDYPAAARLGARGHRPRAARPARRLRGPPWLTRTS